jgi:Holliday junction resolvase RusA-like endonuclease
MKQFSLRIPIEPVAWQRPKTKLVNGWVKHYSPAKTKTYEQRIGEYWEQDTQGFKFEREQAVCVNVVFGLPIPKSTSKRKKEDMLNGIIKHIKKPDTDNLLKAVLDGLNGIAWADDSQVIRVCASKEYSTEPYVYLYVHESVD